MSPGTAFAAVHDTFTPTEQQLLPVSAKIAVSGSLLTRVLRSLQARWYPSSRTNKACNCNRKERVAVN